MSNYDINILVNGNKCRQYLHNGRTYIEAKENSEYVIEIKNNSWEKILAVVSVDGLNVIDGEGAEDKGPGYVLDKYTSQKLYGFQYSQEKVATFKFGALGAVKLDPVTGKPELDPVTGKEMPLGYAASKQNGSEKNAGVIGVRIWDEIPQPPQPKTISIYSTAGGLYGTSSWSCNATFATFATSASYSTNAVYTHNNPQGWNTSNPDPVGGLYGQGRYGYNTSNLNSNLLTEAIADAKAVRKTALANASSAKAEAFNTSYCSQVNEPSEIALNQLLEDMEAENKASFDMETQWGIAKNYKVKETKFERRDIIHKLDIYYASRESLIVMGVDLGSERRVSFPEAFKETKYATPPKGWKG